MATESKRKKLIAKGDFELAGYIRKKVGQAGAKKEYYESGGGFQYWGKGGKDNQKFPTGGKP